MAVLFGWDLTISPCFSFNGLYSGLHYLAVDVVTVIFVVLNGNELTLLLEMLCFFYQQKVLPDV